MTTQWPSTIDLPLFPSSWPQIQRAVCQPAVSPTFAAAPPSSLRYQPWLGLEVFEVGESWNWTHHTPSYTISLQFHRTWFAGKFTHWVGWLPSWNLVSSFETKRYSSPSQNLGTRSARPDHVTFSPWSEMHTPCIPALGSRRRLLGTAGVGALCEAESLRRVQPGSPPGGWYHPGQ